LRVAAEDPGSRVGGFEPPVAAGDANGRKNGGFTAGNILAVAPKLARDPAGSERDVLLRSPEILVRPDAIPELGDIMASHLRAGIAGTPVAAGKDQARGPARLFSPLGGELESAAKFGPLARALRPAVIPMIKAGEAR
jgi:hypothetical protein